MVNQIQPLLVVFAIWSAIYFCFSIWMFGRAVKFWNARLDYWHGQAMQYLKERNELLEKIQARDQGDWWKEK